MKRSHEGLPHEGADRGNALPAARRLRELQERLDPRGAFRNEWLQARVLGTRAGVGRHPA